MDQNKQGKEIIADEGRYNNPEYDDKTVENLMNYLQTESYEQLEDFLKYSHIPMYN